MSIVKMIRTKDNLIEWLINNCPRKAVVRSLQDNGAELLGGFVKIPPSNYSGWIIRTKSVYDRTWIVAITANKTKPDYGIRILDKVPWEYYCGGGSKLYEGDSPSFCKAMKELMLRRKP